MVITECELAGGLSWRDLLAEIDEMGVIVTSKVADERLWAEVLNLGGYDLLMKPLDPAEVLRVVTMAGYQARGAGHPKTQHAMIAVC